VEYTNGDETGLNEYVTKVSWEMTAGGMEVRKGWRWNRS